MVSLKGDPSEHRISLPLGFPSKQLSKEGLPLHTSPYLWYWIVVANASSSIVAELQTVRHLILQPDLEPLPENE